MIYIIGIVVFVVLAIILFKILQEKLETAKTVLTLLGILVAIMLIVTGYYCISYYLKKKNFQSFNLEELKKQELIIQRIDFKKFLISGTEEAGKYTDELQVYLISGYATVSFTDIENLQINETDSDYDNKILRLNYSKKDKNVPFKIDIVISENDIYKVTQFESKEINILGFKKDLIKPDMTQAEKVEAAKSDLKREFEKQIIDTTSVKKLEESDIYQTFLTRMTEIISGMSDWRDVQIDFSRE